MCDNNRGNALAQTGTTNYHAQLGLADKVTFLKINKLLKLKLFSVFKIVKLALNLTKTNTREMANLYTCK